jgi:hypothetical protein
VAHRANPHFLGFKKSQIEALKGTEEFLKVPLRGTFKNSSGFYRSAKRCNH